ncbi:MAG: hypothetical protein ACLP1E_01870 [Acidimicrobiales bacterium]
MLGVQEREDCAFGSTGREVTTCDIAETDPLPSTACVVGEKKAFGPWNIPIPPTSQVVASVSSTVATNELGASWRHDGIVVVRH